MNFRTNMKYNTDLLELYSNCSKPYNLTFKDSMGRVTKDINDLTISEEFKHVLHQYEENGNLEKLVWMNIGSRHNINDFWSIRFDNVYYFKEIMLEGLEKEYQAVSKRYMLNQFPNEDLISKEDLIREYQKIKEESE